MADNTNAGACLSDNECFIQTLGLYQYQYYRRKRINKHTLLWQYYNVSKEPIISLEDHWTDLDASQVHLLKCTYISIRETTTVHGMTYLSNISNISLLNWVPYPLYLFEFVFVRVIVIMSQTAPSYQPST